MSDHVKVYNKDDTLLFYNTNEYRVIKCLIGNPYLKNERLSFNRKGFYLENFLKLAKTNPIMIQYYKKSRVKK